MGFTLRSGDLTMDEIDHLHEAKKRTDTDRYWARSAHELAWTHALIAIAERLDLLIEAQKPIKHDIQIHELPY